MWIDDNYEKRHKKEMEAQKKLAEERKKEYAEAEKLLDTPDNLSDEEKQAWEYIATLLKASTSYKKLLPM